MEHATLASTINILTVALYDLFSADGTYYSSFLFFLVILICVKRWPLRLIFSVLRYMIYSVQMVRFYSSFLFFW